MSSATTERAFVLRGARLLLRPLGPEAVDERYLAWLNDPEVNRFSQRHGHHTTLGEARAYLETLGADETVLGIEVDDLGHVGNVKYGPIDHHNRRCDISILIGEHAAWGRGVGTEAIYLVSRHLFETRGLNRLDAGSANPAFLKLVDKLGWRVEGVLRERVRIGDRFLDWTLVAQLRGEFRRRPEYESSNRREVKQPFQHA